LEQIGTPENIFHASATRFVAEFMGASDFLQGEVSAQGIRTLVGILPQPVSLPPGSPVEIALRSDDMDFSPVIDGSPGNAEIAARFFRGAFNIYRLRLDSGQVLHAIKEHTQILPVGLRVEARISAGHPLAVFHLGEIAPGGQSEIEQSPLDSFQDHITIV
jgi:iron(III) transport system ATP-binding protein